MRLSRRTVLHFPSTTGGVLATSDQPSMFITTISLYLCGRWSPSKNIMISSIDASRWYSSPCRMMLINAGSILSSHHIFQNQRSSPILAPCGSKPPRLLVRWLSRTSGHFSRQLQSFPPMARLTRSNQSIFGARLRLEQYSHLGVPTLSRSLELSVRRFECDLWAGQQHPPLLGPQAKYSPS